MSELTPCNYCTLKGMKDHYKEEGKEVKVTRSKEMQGWLAAEVDGEEIAWFMELTGHCVC